MCSVRGSLCYWILKKDLQDYMQDDLNIFYFMSFAYVCVYLEVPYVIGYLRKTYGIIRKMI
jgi:hypothetical protein